MIKERYGVGIGRSQYRDETITYRWDGGVVRPWKADKLLDYLKKIFGEDIVEYEIKEFEEGIYKKKKYREIWLSVKRERLHDLVNEIARIQVPHLAVCSGSDLGDEIQLIYHFSLFYGIRDREIGIHIKVNLPKSDPTIDTITDILPGALITEREKQEMLGVKVRNIPDPRRCFTSPNLPQGYYPWRKDNDPEVEKKIVKNLVEEGL